MKGAGAFGGWVILIGVALIFLTYIERVNKAPGAMPAEYKGRPYYELYDRGSKWMHGKGVTMPKLFSSKDSEASAEPAPTVETTPPADPGKPASKAVAKPKAKHEAATHAKADKPKATAAEGQQDAKQGPDVWDSVNQHLDRQIQNQ